MCYLICTALCLPGSYSQSGMEPCNICPRNTYQPLFGGKHCLVCEENNEWCSNIVERKFVYIKIQLLNVCNFSFIISSRDKYSRQQMELYYYST